MDKKNKNEDQKNLSQADRAYNYIRNAVLNQQLNPGYPLLETELSEQLGISRTPVREAIHRLKAEGLIESVRRKGIFIKALSKKDIQQNYEIAEGLEGMVAYLVAQRADNDGIKKLEGYVEEMEDALANGNLDKWISSDDNFHLTLHSLCGNDFLVESLIRLHEQIRLTRFVSVTKATVDKIQSTREHRATYEAIRYGDADRARQIMQNHWNHVRLEILKVIP